MRNRYKKRTGIGVISFVVLILFGIILFKRIELQEEKKNKDVIIERLDASIEDEMEREKEIEREKAFRQTDRYIEEEARAKLGLVDKDDIIFKPED